MDITEKCQCLIARGTKPTLPEVWPIIDAWYARPGNEAGGELHVILDDGNLRDRCLISHVMDPRASDESKLVCLVLEMLSPSQRRRL